MAVETRNAPARPADLRRPIHRFPFVERALHWTIAITGILCILTGLGWYSKRSFGFLLALFGGGETARLLHGVAGILLTVASIALIGVFWRRHVFRFIREDWAWAKVMGGYLRRGEEKDAPPQGFFNAGQKAWAILALALAALFLFSGVVIWWPDLMLNFLGQQTLPIALIRWAYVVHDGAFIVFAPMVVLHVYLSTILLPGTLQAMTTGDVSAVWALHHHPLWYSEVAGSVAGTSRG